MSPAVEAGEGLDGTVDLVVQGSAPGVVGIALATAPAFLATAAILYAGVIRAPAATR